MALKDINMKKSSVLILLLFVSFSLFAQNFREVKIHVPPVSGEGIQGDNAYFYSWLTYEVALQHYSMVRALKDSDFTLRGSIVPFSEMQAIMKAKNEDSFYDARSESNQSYSGNTNNEYVFNLELINSVTNKVVGDQYIIYNDIDSSVSIYLSTVVYNMLSWIPDVEVVDDWRDKWVFLEASALWAPHIYIGDYESVNYANFGLRFAAELQIFNFLSVDAGVQFVQNWIVVSATGNEYRDLILEVPLALKLVLKPFTYLLLEPYGGVSLNSSLLGYTEPSKFSWFTGLQVGIKAGRGMVVIDPRFAMDFSKSSIDDLGYRRYMVQIGLGYKIGFFSKKPKPKYY